MKRLIDDSIYKIDVLYECSSKKIEIVENEDSIIVISCFLMAKKMFIMRCLLEHKIENEENPFEYKNWSQYVASKQFQYFFNDFK